MKGGKGGGWVKAIGNRWAAMGHVLGEGRRARIPVRDIGPGDIAFLEAGDRVPAELRLIHARRLLIDEALLTGESVAAEKEDMAVAADAPLGDRRGMAF